ncbi:MAG: hypothetical protein M0Z98_08820 [Actinomycetales bacterium]|nr:hypothetical protein [Actinomycetales bacterium]
MTLAACGSTAGAGLAPPSGGTSALSAPSPGATESNPPGDIPDNQAFVAYQGVSGHYSVEVPEGWARTSSADSASFTDKLNSVTAAETAAPSAPTIASASATVVPALASAVPKFQLVTVATFTRAGGSGVLITYLADSPANPVTGKVVRDAVESFLFWKNGRLVTLSLSGPQSADNVDPWAKVSGSFRWTP